MCIKLPKRLAAIALAACMILTACTPTEKGKTVATKAVALDPKNPVSIEIWHYYNNVQKTAFDEMVMQFNETVGLEQGIIVDAFSQGDVNELIEKVVDSANQKVGASEIPDIFAAYADTAYQIDKMGLLAKLNTYLTPEEIAEYVPSFIDEGLDSKGDIKIFPIAKSTELFMLNTTDWDKFSGATGIDGGGLATVEGITKIAQKYYEWTDAQTPQLNDGMAFFGRDSMANYMIIGMRQLGTEIFEVKDNKITINDDKEKIRRLWDNMYVPSVNGWFGTYGRFRSDDVKTGDIISLVGSLSSAAYFPAKVSVSDTVTYPINHLVLQAPIFEGGEPFAIQQGAGMAVTASDPEHEYASTVFLKWFTQAQRNTSFSLNSSYLPVKKAALKPEALRSFMENTDEKYPVILIESLLISAKMLETGTPYCNRPFEGGSDARRVLESSMTNKIRADLAGVTSLIANGMSRKDAAAVFTTDGNFEAWYEQFHAELIACVGK